MTRLSHTDSKGDLFAPIACAQYKTGVMQQVADKENAKAAGLPGWLDTFFQFEKLSVLLDWGEREMWFS